MTKKTAMTVSMEGMRALEVNRPLAELVREVVQNCLDARPTLVGVRVEKNAKERHVEVEVADDGDGLPNLDVVSTVYLSTKADDATKRGRMGRGLKEAILAADYAHVESTCGSVEVTRHKKDDWSIEEFPRRKLAKGTRVTLHYRSANASREAAEEAANFVRRIVAPAGVYLSVNGHANDALPVVHEYTVRLATVVFAEKEARTVVRETRVFAYRPDASGAWLYELGIPVQPIEHEHSLDVQQRVPMPPHRDTVKPDYLQKLFAQVLNQRVAAGATDEDTLSSKWAIEAAQQPTLLAPETKQAFAKRYVGDATVSRTADEQHKAENWHFKAVPMRAIPKAVRDVVLEAAPRTQDVLDRIGKAECRKLKEGEWDWRMRRAAALWTRVAHEAGYTRLKVAFVAGKPTLNAQMTSGGTMEVFHEVAPWMLTAPLGEESLSTFIHELAHDDKGFGKLHDEVHGREFYDAVERAAAAVAATMRKLAQELDAMERKEAWAA